METPSPSQKQNTTKGLGLAEWLKWREGRRNGRKTRNIL
jgi:hypothetical protein